MDVDDNNSNNTAAAEEFHHDSSNYQQQTTHQIQMQQPQPQQQLVIQPLNLRRTGSANSNSSGTTTVSTVACMNNLNNRTPNNIAISNSYGNSHPPSPIVSPGGVVQVQQHQRPIPHQNSAPTLLMTTLTINRINTNTNDDSTSIVSAVNNNHCYSNIISTSNSVVVVDNDAVVDIVNTEGGQQQLQVQNQPPTNVIQNDDGPENNNNIDTNSSNNNNSSIYLNVENMNHNSNDYVQQGIITDSSANTNSTLITASTVPVTANRHSHGTEGRNHTLTDNNNGTGSYVRANGTENHNGTNYNNTSRFTSSFTNATSPTLPVSCGWTEVMSSTQATPTITGRRNFLNTTNDTNSNNRYVGPTNALDGFAYHPNQPQNNYNSDRIPSSNSNLHQDHLNNTNIHGNNNSALVVVPNHGTDQLYANHYNDNNNNNYNMNATNYTNATTTNNSNNNNNNNTSTMPSPRSLHSTALLNGIMYIFGGYDGTQRVNSFHAYSFAEKRWSPVLPSANSGPPPSPRDRHVSVAYGNSIYIHGGFEGVSRDGSLFCFDFSTMTWREITPTSPPPPARLHQSSSIVPQQQAPHHRPPSARHSHAAVVYEDSMYVFGGYDGSYKSDLHEYNFVTNRWCPVPAVGRRPRPRYRASCVVYMNTMILYGGHDGTRHLSDTLVFDFLSLTWSTLVTDGIQPVPRDSHVAVVHMNSMYVFGGSSGAAMNDLHELQLPSSGIMTFSSATNQIANTGTDESNNNTNNIHPSSSTDTNNANNTTSIVARWRPIRHGQSPPRPRFCHVAVTYNDSMYVFGGYDGIDRLNSFIKFDFSIYDLSFEIPPSTLVHDFRSLVNNEELSDITFIVENRPIYAHKLMLMRCSYFQALFSGYMKESTMDTIRIEQVRYPIFLGILEYLYTDQIETIPYPIAMEYFVAADLFGISRFKTMCEKCMIQNITIDNAASIFHAADVHSASALRQRAKRYILNHFEETSKTHAFEDMGRQNVDLVFELLHSR